MSELKNFWFDHEQLISFCKRFKPADNIHGCALKVEEGELERRWTELISSYKKVVTGDELESDSKEMKNVTTKYEDACRIYTGCKSKIALLIESKQTSKADESLKLNSTMQLGQSSVKVPPCDTPPFEGGYSKWPAFRDIFWAVFGTHVELSPAQKLFHLRGKTRGEANQIVSRFDLVDENFQLAWDALKDRYENPRILVHQQMKYFFGIPAAQHETPKSIRQIQRGINDSLSIFKSYKIQTQNWDPILVYHCATKLPEESLRAWEDSITNHKQLPTWEQMDTFLTKRIEILETIFDMKKPNSRDNQQSHHKSQSFQSRMDSTSHTTCKKCNQNHPLRICDNFKALSVKDRIKFVYSNKICANCLSSTHMKTNCTSTKSCRECQKKHHTLLHLQPNQYRNTSQYNRVSQRTPIQQHSTENNTPPADSISETPVEEVQAHFTEYEGTTILPTALINIEHAGESFTIRALLDAGSEKSFISKRVQQNLAIPVDNHHSQISGLGGTIVGNSSGRCFVNLRSIGSNFSITIKAIVVSKLSHFLPSKRVKITNLHDIQKLNLADPHFFKPAPIDMIIGSDYLPLINLNGVLSNIAHGLEARESRFGWYLSGPLPTNEIQTFSTIVSDSDDLALNEQIKKFWEIEEVTKISSASENDEYCEELYQKTTFRQPDGRYVVRLPFRQDFPEKVFLGPSRHMALAQYLRMEKTLNKNPELKQQYELVLQEYIELDHMQQVNHCESASEKHFSFFLPHHAVLKPESKTTKVRVVFNGSKKTNSGFSLNDVLYSGPILQSDIIEIILNWRYYRYVFTGDIQKMYRQILVHPADRPFQRILFRPAANDTMKSYELKTVTFGINCAPFLAIRTLKELSRDCHKASPAASKVLQNEVYVDDVLSGGHTLDEAKAKQDELSTTLISAAFPLKKVTSNTKSLLEKIAREDLLDEEFLNFDDSSTTKTLGIRWNAMSDYFYYVVGSISSSSNVTKRQILSVIARLFDPLGWLGPIVILAKILMQQLWEEKTNWDEPVPQHLFIKWTSFRENLPYLHSLKIPRWVDFSPWHKVQIHGFCDASEKAYCGVVYIRIDNFGELSSHLLVGKTRVAPIKRTTIPKLELCGALLLANLMNKVIKTLDHDHDLYLWTDSSIVLGWLRKNPQTLKTFVANRVTEILSLSNKTSWRHIKTEENPADLGTRGCLPPNLIQNLLWWQGPSWLQKPQSIWPEPRTFSPTDLETKKVSNFHLSISDDVTSRFSSLNRSLRVMCYVVRYIQSCRKILRPKTIDITSEEIALVKHRLITVAQKMYYPREYECLSNEESISNKSHILTLSPFLDKNGLLRVGGRLGNSGLRYDERHPVIIPEKSHFAELLVRYTHQIMLHAEYNVMLRAIRQAYYIPRLKNLIRKCVRGCKICTIYKSKWQQQLMAALPPERSTFSLPFTYTGVDFAGPFSLKTSTLKNAKITKGYVAVFVCFSTRAVHLEVCSDLSAEGFLAAFTRFTGRRGLPKTMFSDNGRNFVGASRQLLQQHNLFLKSAEKCLSEKHAIDEFTWSFIPPHAPHMGGIWEAAVKSMKSHLKKLSKNLSFTFEEFSTILVRIESILNSRPLSPLSQNPSELLPLTPGHFLRGAPLTAPPEGAINPPKVDLTHLQRWKRLQTIQHLFSLRWKSEYVTELQRRYKWKTTRNNLKVNDFVVVKDDFLPSTEWRLGRITKTFLGKDNNVRVAEIKTQNGSIVRPVVKLCILPNT